MAKRFAKLEPDPALGAPGALLYYLLVRERGLEPVADPARRDVFHYAEEVRLPELHAWTQSLCDAGLLRADIVETFNSCPACASARLLVRDQCGACGHSVLEETRFIHHFACAWQAPEASFRIGGNALQCPKCRKGLTHISVDYECSATVFKCGACGVEAPDPVVGYRCLDCDNQGMAVDLKETHATRFTLTEEAYAHFSRTPAAMAAG